jgi:hypothetical protein
VQLGAAQLHSPSRHVTVVAAERSVLYAVRLRNMFIERTDCGVK